VDRASIGELCGASPDFVRAYEPDGLSTGDFETYPPTVRTLRVFIGSCHDLLAAVTDALLPNPDVGS
jgi:transaldolase